MDGQLVAVWAHSLGATVMASVAAAATTATVAAIATTTIATTTTTVVSLGHCHHKSRVLLHDEIKLLTLGIKFCV
jgi:hypothetical protein